MVPVAQAEQFYEQDYDTPSEDGFEVMDTREGKSESQSALTGIIRKVSGQRRSWARTAF